ncbi:MAG: hypothetical protein E6H06_19475 [Bacteroidetes bacterium]|nr:MAG: hypothetical protein E6H06_19475 [Bacteroidota bacterium]
MTKLLTILSFLPLLSSCSSTKTVSFGTRNNKGQAFIYSLKLPRGYTLTRLNFENENADTYTYPDSSRIFFSDNLAASAFYKNAYTKYGKDINTIFLSKDTITISGQDDVGRHWKTIKQYNVVYGYVQVSVDKQDQFDKILHSFKEKQP